MGDQLDDWVGPNLQDNLGKKWRRMEQHQVKLSQQSATKTQLATLGADNPTPGLWVKGWLFNHPDNASTLVEPYPINPSHARGWWVRKSELSGFLKQHTINCSYILPGKPNWLIPVSAYCGLSLSLRQLMMRVAGTRQPEQIWCVLGEGVSRQIISRGFVVPDDWAEGYAG